MNVVPLAVAGVLAVALTWFTWESYGAKFGVYLILGLALGVTLFHSRFGFTSAWRQLTAVGNGQGLRAQSLLLGTAASMVALISSTGLGLFGNSPQPVAAPLGLGLLIGAALFAIGMQLAGSCASGTLYAVGAGQSTILLTLGGFIAGAVSYTWAFPVLGHLPQLSGILLADHFGWLGSWGITMAALGGAVLLSRFVQARRNPPPTALDPTAHGIARLYRGTWPVLVGAVVLGVLAGLVFLASGSVWGLVNAFAVWGAKILQVFGLHPENWEFWHGATESKQLSSPVLTDRTSLTNFGIMIGAAIAAAAAGAWQLHSRVPWRTALAALLGGIMMGVGSRMAGGCNIGAYLGGISEGSVSGWVWGAVALGGTWIGVRLRPLFGLVNPKADDSIC